MQKKGFLKQLLVKLVYFRIMAFGIIEYSYFPEKKNNINRLIKTESRLNTNLFWFLFTIF